MKKILSVLACYFLLAFAMAQQADNSATVYISKLKIQYGFSPLPVTFVSFNGTIQNNQVLLSWETATESNNFRFEILRLDPERKAYLKIGEVSSKGNSNVITSYHFADISPLAGTNYYQLRQVDFDGKSTLSKVVTVEAGLNSTAFKVYSSTSDNHIANFYSDQNMNVTLTLIDASGRVLNQVDFAAMKGNNVVTLYNRTLNPGVYIGRLDLNGNLAIAKFLVN